MTLHSYISKYPPTPQLVCKINFEKAFLYFKLKDYNLTATLISYILVNLFSLL